MGAQVLCRDPPVRAESLLDSMEDYPPPPNCLGRYKTGEHTYQLRLRCSLTINAVVRQFAPHAIEGH